MKKKRSLSNYVKILAILIAVVSIFLVRFGFFSKSKEVKEYGSVYTKKLFIQSNLKAKIDKILVKENDYIKKGDQLVQFDCTVLNAKINHIDKKIAFEKEKINYLKFKEEKILEEYLNLKKEKTQDVNEISDKLKNLESLQLNQKIQRSKIDILVSEEEYLNTLKNNSVISSPCDGYINNIFFLDNSYVSVGDKVISVVTTDKPYAVFKIKKNKVLQYKINDLLKVEIDNYPMANFQGKIVDIKLSAGSSFVEFKVSLNQIKGSLEEQNLLLTSNMRASIVHE